MWITAIIGGATAFIESTLAQIYKKRADDGTCYGGPAFYMQHALKQRWLGVIFSALIILIYAVGYNMLAAYNLQSAFAVFDFYDAGVTPRFIGLILAVLFGIIVLGGAKRLIKVTEVLVPLMGIIYVLVSLVIMAINITALPGMIAGIFRQRVRLSRQWPAALQAHVSCGVSREVCIRMKQVWVLRRMQLQELISLTRQSRASFRCFQYSSIHCSSVQQQHSCA